MKNLKFILIVIIALISSSCSKEILDASNLRFDSPQEGNSEIDKWLRENYLQPYNIEVLYKWDKTELATTNTLVPPDEKFVIPVMEMVKKSWIDVYNAMGDPLFIKKHSPKQYMLVGSPEYNSSGGLTTGIAEGGTKIALFRINWFDTENRPLIKRILKTVHHEYVHILNQKKRYPDEFEVVSSGQYTSTFAQLSDKQANELGFISSYAASGPGEDIAEMISIILTEGKQGYEDILSAISNQDAVAKLRSKEAIIVDYYKTYWSIDFYALIVKTQESINELSPIDLNQYFGTLYSTIYLDFDDPSMWGPEGMAAVSSTKLAFKNQLSRNLDYINLVYNPSTPTMAELQFRFALTDFTQRATGSVYLKVDFDAASNRIRFSNPTASGSNATFVWAGLTPFLNYITSKTFKVKFKEGYNKDTQGENIGGLISIGGDSEFAYGTLTKPQLNRFLGLSYKNLNLHIFDETYWHGAALQAIQSVKSKALTLDSRKIDYFRMVVNNDIASPTASLFLKFSTTSLTASATAEKKYTVTYDKFENKLSFSNPVATGSNANIVKNALDEFDAYLTSRDFKVEFYQNSSFEINGDNYAKISNTTDPSDYFVVQLNPLLLNLEIGRSIHYFNYQNKGDEFYGGDALTALSGTRNDLSSLHGHTYFHYQLKLDIEARLATFSMYTKTTPTGAFQGSTITMDINYDRAQNRITFSNVQYTNALAKTLQPGWTKFMNYFISRPFRFAYKSGSHYYMMSGAQGQMIDINNASNFINLPL